MSNETLSIKAESNKQKEMLDLFLDKHPDIELFEIVMVDLNGQLRGKWIERNKIGSLLSGGIKLPLSSSLFDIWGQDPADIVFDNGDQDGICQPVLSTLTRLPWVEKPTGQVLVSLIKDNGEPYTLDARYVLAQQQHRLQSLGLQPVMAFEMEFYLFKKDRPIGQPPELAQTSSHQLPAGQTYGIDTMREIGDFLIDIRSASQQMHLPIDTLICEAAPSQYEINLHHQADALLAADQAVLLKRVIQGIADKHGFKASFMAKPFGEQAGSGMHIHCSLIDSEGHNVFETHSPQSIAPFLKYALGGCLQTLPDTMLLLAPHANSYRRFINGSHAPIFANWGLDNRTVALRVPAGSAKATRIEHRVAGADANPYLVAAALLAGIHFGIDNKTELPCAETGNAYEGNGPTLPLYWQKAIEQFSNSAFIGQYYGETFKQFLTVIKEQEVQTFNRIVSALEYDTYL